LSLAEQEKIPTIEELDPDAENVADTPTSSAPEEKQVVPINQDDGTFLNLLKSHSQQAAEKDDQSGQHCINLTTCLIT